MLLDNMNSSEEFNIETDPKTLWMECCPRRGILHFPCLSAAPKPSKSNYWCSGEPLEQWQMCWKSMKRFNLGKNAKTGEKEGLFRATETRYMYAKRLEFYLYIWISLKIIES